MMKINIILIPLLLFIQVQTKGQIIFQKTFYGNGFNYPWTCNQTVDGGYILSGVADAANNPYPIVIKTDEYGDTLWTIPGVGHAFAQETLDGGFIMNANSGNTHLVKMDSNRNILWSKNYNGVNYPYYPLDLQQTQDGGFVMLGNGAFYGNNDTSNIYLYKTDSLGNLLWSRNFGGADDDLVRSIRQTSDGGFILAGSTWSFGAGDQDIFIVKTDSSGLISWAKTYGGINDDYGLFVQQTTDGGFIILGSVYNTVKLTVIKTDSIGNSTWIKNYSSSITYIQGSSIRQVSDGGYIVSGFGILAGFRHAILFKTDSAGSGQWMKAYNGSYNDMAVTVEETNDNGFIVLANYNGGNNQTRICLIKTDSLGNSGCNEINGIITTTNTTVTTTNPIIQQISDTVLASNGVVFPDNPINISTICTGSVGIETLENPSFIISPNPTKEFLFLTIPHNIEKCTVQVLNLQGEILTEEHFFNQINLKMNVSTFAAGVYLVKLFDGQNTICNKLVLL